MNDLRETLVQRINYLQSRRNYWHSLLANVRPYSGLAIEYHRLIADADEKIAKAKAEMERMK